MDPSPSAKSISHGITLAKTLSDASGVHAFWGVGVTNFGQGGAACCFFSCHSVLFCVDCVAHSESSA